MKISRIGIFISALPGIISLGFYYSLAIHMRLSLGAWPTSIGERGFPSALITHAAIEWNYFWLLLLFSISIVPAAILVCLLTPRWRGFAKYFVFHTMAVLACIGLMWLAPKPFVHWWLD